MRTKSDWLTHTLTPACLWHDRPGQPDRALTFAPDNNTLTTFDPKMSVATTTP